MLPRPFELERYFSRFEFRTPLLLASSDCESLTLPELLTLADSSDTLEWTNLKLGYTESAGLPELREQVAKLYPGLTAANVLVAVPEEAIYLIARTLLHPSDRVIVTTPAYQSLAELAITIGCEVSPWEATEAEGRWRFDPERLEELAQTGTKAIIVNFPHNPTGASPTPREWTRILECAERVRARLISDEMYRGLEYDSHAVLTPAAVASKRGISIGGLSKAHGLPGLRVGWLAMQDSGLQAKVQCYKDYTTICGSAPSERLAVIALKNQDNLVARCRAIISRNLPQVEAFAAKHSEWIDWRPPTAGPIAFPRLRQGGASALCEDLADRAGVMLLPSAVYGLSDEHVRMGFGRQNLPEALAALDCYLCSR